MRLLLFIAALSLTAEVVAETYCVSSESELLAAIASAQQTPGSSSINVTRGTYDFASFGSAAAINISSAGGSLAIVGGYNAGCQGSTNDVDTTQLRAVGASRLMDIDVYGDNEHTITLRRLSLRFGRTADTEKGGCLTVSSNQDIGGTVKLNRLSFKSCSTTVAGASAALKVVGRGMRLELNNAIFADNSSRTGVIGMTASGSSTLYITNNTVTNNLRPYQTADVAGLTVGTVGSGGFIWLVNNILYDNGNAIDKDVLFNSGMIGVANSNIIGQRNEYPGSMAQSGNSDANPQFVSQNSLQISENSPARNTGNNLPAGGLATSDFSGEPRLQGGQVDRGAVEFSELFASGFETD